MEQSKKTDDILILSVLAVSFGIWSLIHYISTDLLFLRNSQIYNELLRSQGAALAQVTYFGSIASPIIYVLFIVGGISVFKLKNWGRNLLIVISVIELINSFVLPYIYTTILSNDSSYARFIPTPMPILYLVNIWFLNRKATKEKFKRT